MRDAVMMLKTVGSAVSKRQTYAHSQSCALVHFMAAPARAFTRPGMVPGE